MSAHDDKLALRRLNAVLNDEEYGPKLVRLNRADERRVLDLIEAGKGREARKEIVRCDTLRLTKSRVGRYIAKAKPDRIASHPRDESSLFWHLYDKGVAA